jgi:hypothetical protein
MSIFLNARSNQFKFLFPKGFLLPEIDEKYKQYLKDLPTPYADVRSFLNSTVQSISFPGVTGVTPVEQIQSGRKIAYRQGYKFSQVINKDFTVTFRLVDAYLNYWLMYEQLMRYTNYAEEHPDDPDREFFPDFEILYLTNNGNLTILQTLKQILFLGITDLTPSYTDISNNTKTFTCAFRFNYFELQVHPMEYNAFNVGNVYR